MCFLIDFPLSEETEEMWLEFYLPSTSFRIGEEGPEVEIVMWIKTTRVYVM